MKRLLIARPLALPLMLPLVVALFASASLFVKPHLALGEGSVPDPSVTMISKQVDRITALRKELETAHVRIMSSPSLPKTGQMAIRTIDGTLSGLTLIESQLLALRDMFMLYGLITDEGLVSRGKIILDQYKESLKDMTESCTSFIEQALNLVEDQETSRLLLKAHGIYRSSNDLLDRIEYPKRR